MIKKSSDPTAQANIVTGIEHRGTRKSVILLAAIVIAVVIIGIVLILSFFRAPAQNQAISIQSASATWTYNEFSRGYICNEVRFVLTNNNVPASHYLWVVGKIEGQTFTMMTNALNLGETKTVSNTFVGITVSQAGDHSLTLEVSDGITGSLVGQGTFSIYVP